MTDSKKKNFYLIIYENVNLYYGWWIAIKFFGSLPSVLYCALSIFHFVLFNYFVLHYHFLLYIYSLLYCLSYECTIRICTHIKDQLGFFLFYLILHITLTISLMAIRYIRRETILYTIKWVGTRFSYDRFQRYKKLIIKKNVRCGKKNTGSRSIYFM